MPEEQHISEIVNFKIFAKNVSENELFLFEGEKYLRKKVKYSIHEKVNNQRYGLDLS